MLIVIVIIMNDCIIILCIYYVCDRLYYLGLYIEGEPHNVIEGYLVLNTEEAYKDAQELLIERYGNSFIIGQSYQRKLDFLKSCRSVIASIGCLSLDSIEENRKLLDKLPNYIVNRWNCLVDTRMYKENGSFSLFVEFVDCLIPEIRQRNTILTTKLDFCTSQRTYVDKHKYANKRTTGVRSFSSGINEIPKQIHSKCVLCKELHNLQNCPNFKRMTLKDRQSTVMSHALCFGCLTIHVCRNVFTL